MSDFLLGAVAGIVAVHVAAAVVMALIVRDSDDENLSRMVQVQ